MLDHTPPAPKPEDRIVGGAHTSRIHDSAAYSTGPVAGLASTVARVWHMRWAAGTAMMSAGAVIAPRCCNRAGKVTFTLFKAAQKPNSMIQLLNQLFYARDGISSY